MREETLLRSSNKVATYIENCVKTAGSEKREEVLQLFDNMHRLFPNWVISTCPMLHPDIHYITQNAFNVFGYSQQFMIDNSSMEKYFRLVHEDDQEDLHRCVSFMHDALEATPPEEHQQQRAILHYRFKKPNGRYIYLHDEKSILHLKGSGNLYYSLFRDITDERPFNGVKVELFRQGQMLEKINEYKPGSERNTLSKREREVLAHIRQGLSTKEIAYYLNISHNTVRNIKSRLFEKYNVNNSIELLNMAG